MNETREIPLNHGLKATVSLVDYPVLSQYHWYANKNGESWYAMTHSVKNANGGPVLMHHLIPVEGEGDKVIHRNGDTLYNTRENLVYGTHSQSLGGQRLSRSNSSGYKGVSKSGRKWRAAICVGRRRIHIGVRDTPEEAALLYDEAAIEHFGKFARLNFPLVGFTCIRDDQP